MFLRGSATTTASHIYQYDDETGEDMDNDLEAQLDGVLPSQVSLYLLFGVLTVHPSSAQFLSRGQFCIFGVYTFPIERRLNQ